MESREFYTVSQLANLFHVRKHTVLRMVRLGKIPHFKPTFRHILIPKAWVNSLAKDSLERPVSLSPRDVKRGYAPGTKNAAEETPKPVAPGRVDEIFTPETARALKRSGVRRISQLLTLTPMAVRSIDDIGTYRYAEIKRRLHARGLRLKNGYAERYRRA